MSDPAPMTPTVSRKRRRAQSLDLDSDYDALIRRVPSGTTKFFHLKNKIKGHIRAFPISYKHRLRELEYACVEQLS
jgi:hypothetical protein